MRMQVIAGPASSSPKFVPGSCAYRRKTCNLKSDVGLSDQHRGKELAEAFLQPGVIDHLAAFQNGPQNTQLRRHAPVVTNIGIMEVSSGMFIVMPRIK